MLICRNAEGESGKRNVGNPCSSLNDVTLPRSLEFLTVSPLSANII